MLLGPLLIQTRKTVMPIGLEETVQHPHTSLTILDAGFWFLNWSSEIHVMGIIRICNLDILDIFWQSNNSFSSRGTNGYIVSVSEQATGPWTTIRSGTFTEDPRQHPGQYNPQTSETFYFPPVLAQYVKFTCTSYYGLGCALQYVGVSNEQTGK